MRSEIHIMHLKVSILLSFFCFFLAGCSIAPNELKTAERIMDTHPDSALYILQHLKPVKYKSGSDRALYGLLLFQALDQKGKQLPPDSIITFSLNYYQKTNDNPHIVKSLYYKARINKWAQRYDVATLLYLKTLDLAKNNRDYFLLGKISSDMGDMFSLQKDYKESLKKYQQSIIYFNKAGNNTEARFRIISIGKINYYQHNYKKAQAYFKKALSQTKDSLLQGTVYQELGINYYLTKRYDSAQYFLRKSLYFPYKGTNYAIRCNVLAELYTENEQVDSAFKYATMVLKYPATFYNQRDSYRILTNIEFARKNFEQTKIYMGHYQDCVDSIHKVESQSKSTILENLHNTTQEADSTKRSMMLIVSLLLVFLLLSSLLVIYLYKRNNRKKKQLNAFKLQLNNKQEFVSQGLTKKIEDAKAQQAVVRKNASVEYKEKLDKELYNIALHLNNLDDFNREMNHAFNNIIVTLKTDYPTVNQKELIWCCLHLLDIPHADRMLVLEATSDSLYKLKQRLAQKLNLKTTKDLDCFLRNMTEIKES